MAFKYLNWPPIGWFVRDVLPISTERRDEWCAFMIDVDPDSLEHKHRTPREVFVYIPGKHRDSAAAWDAVRDMLATRH